MRLAIDIGNTATKWATFDGNSMTTSGRWENSEILPGEVAKFLANGIEAMVCASGEVPKELSSLPRLSSAQPLPIKLDYKTPQTLGPDRIAAACGAHRLHPTEPCLVVDAGTCITVDFIDGQGTYHGGAIMPGIKMKLSALHTMTTKLPLIDIGYIDHTPVLGRSTEECMVAGTLGATLMALAGFVTLYKEKSPGLKVVLTGGDAGLLNTAGGWEHEPNLTLMGINEAMASMR